MTKKEIRKTIDNKVSELWNMQSDFAEKGRKAEADKKWSDAKYYQYEEMRVMHQRWALLDLAEELGIVLDSGIIHLN